MPAFASVDAQAGYELAMDGLALDQIFDPDVPAVYSLVELRPDFLSQIDLFDLAKEYTKLHQDTHMWTVIRYELPIDKNREGYVKALTVSSNGEMVKSLFYDEICQQIQTA